MSISLLKSHIEATQQKLAPDFGLLKTTKYIVSLLEEHLHKPKDRKLAKNLDRLIETHVSTLMKQLLERQGLEKKLAEYREEYLSQGGSVQELAGLEKVRQIERFNEEMDRLNQKILRLATLMG